MPFASQPKPKLRHYAVARFVRAFFASSRFCATIFWVQHSDRLFFSMISSISRDEIGISKSLAGHPASSTTDQSGRLPWSSQLPVRRDAALPGSGSSKKWPHRKFLKGPALFFIQKLHIADAGFVCSPRSSRLASRRPPAGASAPCRGFAQMAMLAQSLRALPRPLQPIASFARLRAAFVPASERREYLLGQGGIALANSFSEDPLPRR
jgi:hypothetical protein